MARIRTIKPQFWENEELSEVSECACLLAIALLNYSDDEGYFNANEKLIKAACFPIRDTSSTIRRMLDELSNIGYLEFARDDDHRIYGRVINFSKHQRIDRPQKSKISDLQLIWFNNLQFDEYSTNARRSIAAGIRKGISNKEEGKGSVIDDFDFEKFWDLYDKKIGDKNKIQKKWIALKESERDLIFSTLPDYINSQPDKKYRKNPETYLNNKSWLDEIIKQTPGPKLNVETSNKGLGETSIETAAKVRQSLIEKYTSKDYEHPHS